MQSFTYVTDLLDKIILLEKQNAILLDALKGDVIQLANLASMVDEPLTKELMTTVYAAIAQVKG